MLMAFKKSCGNMIKFATKNMPHAIIQVGLNSFKNTPGKVYFSSTPITPSNSSLGCYNSGVLLWIGHDVGP